MQINRSRNSDDNNGPEENPAPSQRRRDRIVEYVAMPPLCLAVGLPGIGCPAIKAGWANMLRSQLQIAQGAEEPAALLAARLKRLVRMKEACSLFRHCNSRARIGPGD